MNLLIEREGERERERKRERGRGRGRESERERGREIEREREREECAYLPACCTPLLRHDCCALLLWMWCAIIWSKLDVSLWSSLGSHLVAGRAWRPPGVGERADVVVDVGGGAEGLCVS